MSHNDNYLRIILRQWLRHYRPTGEGTGEGACLALPEKKLLDTSQTIYITQGHSAQFGVLMRPCARPVKFPPR